MSKNKYQKAIDKVVAWATNRGYDVDFGGSYEDRMSEFEKIITINTRFKPEIQLYALLHECGHVLIRCDKKRYKRHFRVLASAETLSRTKHSFNKRSYRSKAWQVDQIAEEIDAWRKGRELAKRLKIKINEDTYDKEIGRWVFTYISYAYERINKKR